MEENPNQAAIELLRSWLKEPMVRELFCQEWFCWVLPHGERSRYPLPSLAFMYDAPLCWQSEEKTLL